MWPYSIQVSIKNQHFNAHFLSLRRHQILNQYFPYQSWFQICCFPYGYFEGLMVGYCSYIIDKSSSMLFEITELSDGFSETSLFSKMILIKNWQLRFPNTKSKHHKTANQRSHDQSQLDICNFTPWLSLAPELRSIHLQILTIVIIKLEWRPLRKTNLLGPLTERSSIL